MNIKTEKLQPVGWWAIDIFTEQFMNDLIERKVLRGTFASRSICALTLTNVEIEFFSIQ